MTTEEERKELIALFEQHAKSIGAVRGWCDTLEATLNAIRDRVFAEVALEGDPKGRILFCSPVTGQIEMGGNVWGGAWFSATAYAEYYTATGSPAYHTGVDLNLNSPAPYSDSGKPVYASADGEVIYCGPLSGWQRTVIVIKHTLENGATVYTRYGHIDNPYVAKGDKVKMGAKIAVIGDYGGNGPKQDHLHYDVAFTDLEKHPGDWPGGDLNRVKTGYANPVMWHTERRT